ncbi:MAG TPA: type II toxin-antitoxin system VapC family toxin [Candidatus Bathyarchaeia archaeon]|nr:type II toxin-antitoxin system VapC family toxin [Candidatus Bathyarchaeia archaeon]
MVCLDTAFLADLFRKNPAAEMKLKEFVDAREEISITVMTVAELYFGAYKSNRLEEEKAKVEQIKRRFLILEMNESGAQKFGELLSRLEKSGKTISDRDVLIAAIAISKGENTIVTRNEKDFARISELSVITY